MPLKDYKLLEKFVKDNFLCQINEKLVGTSNITAPAVPDLPTFNLRLSQ